MKLDVELRTMDTSENFALKALLDCGATGLFIDQAYVQRNHLRTRELRCSIPVYNVDGTLNEAGSIRHIVELVLSYKDHTERAQFAVTNLGNQDLILGLSWLREHNPEVDWQTEEVKMSRCPERCRMCFEEAKTERKAKEAEIKRIRACREGSLPRPTIEEVDGEDDDVPALVDDEEDDELEDGDRVFMTVLQPEAEFIRASSNISQRLTEAFD